jgi:hypothetical protein
MMRVMTMIVKVIKVKLTIVMIQNLLTDNKGLTTIKLMHLKITDHNSTTML